jgi:hypothetical protein
MPETVKVHPEIAPVESEVNIGAELEAVAGYHADIPDINFIRYLNHYRCLECVLTSFFQ